MFKSAGWLVAASCWIVSSGMAVAQENGKYRELPVTQLPRDVQTLASNFSRSKASASDEAKEALSKVIILEISKLTRSDRREDYGKIRQNLTNIYLNQPRQPREARQIVIDTLVRYAGGVALSSQFSPASRISCVAILAELDQLQPDSDSSTREIEPPLPAPAAFLRLEKLVSEQDTPSYLKAAALHGIERHARVNVPIGRWDEDRIANVEKLMLSVVTAEPVSAIEKEPNAWLVRRALDVLKVMRSPVAADAAIGLVGSSEELPSVRLSAIEYLANIDSESLPADLQQQYVMGLAHFLRTRLVDWYEAEDDRLKRQSGAAGMGGGSMMGGYGGDMMGGYGGPGGGYGGGGGDYGGGGEVDYGSMMGGYPGGDTGYGGPGGRDNKPIDSQDWDTRLARRLVNQLTQEIHIALDGRANASDTDPRVPKPLAAAELDEELQTVVSELVTLVENFQDAVNDAQMVTDVDSLLTVAQEPIEDIMDFAIEIPGFSEKYTEMEDEQLERAPTIPGAGGAAGEGPANAPGNGVGGENGDPSQPGQPGPQGQGQGQGGNNSAAPPGQAGAGPGQNGGPRNQGGQPGGQPQGQ